MDPKAREAWCERLSAKVQKVKVLERRRATKRQIRKPVEDAAKLAEKLREVLERLPVELFTSEYDPGLLDRLYSDLLTLRHRAIGSPLTGDGGAMELLRNRKQPDSRYQRHYVLGSAVAAAYRDLTGQKSTCYTDPDTGGTVGSFPEFLREIATTIGLDDKEVSAIVENRRTRYRSAYASVRAEGGKP